MGQKRYFEFRSDDASIDFSNWFVGVIVPGLYRGYDFVPTNTLMIRLNHDTTGIQHTEVDGNLGPKKGLFVTTQGLIIKDDTVVEMPIEVGSSEPRIDLIVVTHEYSESVVGGTSAIYSIIKGAPAPSPVAPALSFPQKQTLLGQLYVPANMTALNQEGVSYVRASSPEFNGGAEKIYVDTRFESIDDSIESLQLNKLDASIYNTFLTNAFPLKLDASIYNAFLANAFPLKLDASIYNAFLANAFPLKLDASIYNAFLANAFPLKLDASIYNAFLANAFPLKLDASIYNAFLANAFPLKADIAQPAWINLTLRSGFSGSIKYRINTIGQVEITANISWVTGSWTPNIINPELPVEIRPGNNNRPFFSDTNQPTRVNDQRAVVTIVTNGEIFLASSVDADGNIPAGTARFDIMYRV
jgi:hypothetical protein